jgi:hypothetical protein
MEILNFQLDNIGWENNQNVLAYILLLVNFGFFIKVNLGFLLIGHAHDQSNKIFS